MVKNPKYPHCSLNSSNPYLFMVKSNMFDGLFHRFAAETAPGKMVRCVSHVVPQKGRSVLMQETETARGVYGQCVAEKMSWTPGLSWFIPMCHHFFMFFSLGWWSELWEGILGFFRKGMTHNLGSLGKFGKVLNRPRRRGKDFMTWVKSENLPPKPQRIPLPMTRRSQATSQNRDMIQYIYIYYI